jgi:hypothetical protein
MGVLFQKWFSFDGERFPVLFCSDGLPAFSPNLYLVCERRSHCAANTLLRDGRAIMQLMAWASSESIDVEERFAARQFLTLIEVESLARACHLRYEALLSDTDRDEAPKLASGRRLISMPGVSAIAASTVYYHLSGIAEYLRWLGTLAIQRLADDHESRSQDALLSRMTGWLLARRPGSGGRNVLGLREGLDQPTLTLLLDTISPVATGNKMPALIRQWQWSEKNPWEDHAVRARNFLMVSTLLNLGIRAGELLNLKVSDIDFGKNLVTIRRRPDDPDDPRLHKPDVKRLDRRVPLNNASAHMISCYLSEVRRPWLRSKRNTDQLFLWVARDGSPLSLASLRKVWHTLRRRVPELPQDLCSHVLRHTWNELFSRAKDAKRKASPTLIEQNNEEKERAYLEGWSETSGTAQVYTRRHIREKASIASLELQTEIRNNH